MTSAHVQVTTTEDRLPWPIRAVFTSHSSPTVSLPRTSSALVPRVRQSADPDWLTSASLVHGYAKIVDVLLRLAHLGATNTLAMLPLPLMSNRDKDVEILALRHQRACPEISDRAGKARSIAMRTWRHTAHVYVPT
jgi:hypothetical protein